MLKQKIEAKKPEPISPQAYVASIAKALNRELEPEEIEYLVREVTERLPEPEQIAEAA